MWHDETDATQLAQRLRVGPRELVEAVGGPWFVVTRDPEREIRSPGTLFVGRAGPSVAILVSDEVDPVVVVAVAEGTWPDPGTLHWEPGRVVATMTVPERTAPAAETDLLLEAMRGAVDAAYAIKAPALVTCRYCGALVAPEHAFGEEACHGCGSAVFGVVY
jgi:hypothetical protein